MALNFLGRRTFSIVAREMTPLRKGDPEAAKPVNYKGKRVFPPTVDENGNVTYYHEFPGGWKPYSFNYVGHGWLVASQVVLWLGVLSYEVNSENSAEKERGT